MNGTLYTWDGKTQISKVSNIWFERPLRKTQGFPCSFRSHEWLSPNDTEKKAA